MKDEETRLFAEMLKAVAHPTRLRILEQLLRGAMCVSAVTKLVPARQVNVSQHLAVLRHAGLVDYVEHGALRCYYLLRPSFAKGLLDLLNKEHQVITKSKDEVLKEMERVPKPARASRGR